MARAAIYNLVTDYSVDEGGLEDKSHNVTDPYWIIAIIRLGEPLSFDRKTGTSVSKDLSAGALLRAVHPLIISDACWRVDIQGNKSSHTKTLTCSLKQDNVNYLVEVLPDDWIFCWMVNNRDDYLSLLDRIDKSATSGQEGLECNRFMDGLKFIGRVDDIYKDTQIEAIGGNKTSGYTIKATAFRELETQMYYDYALATRDAGGGDFGWLARFGVSVDALFRENAEHGIEQNNINKIIPTMLDLVLGKGPSRSGNINIKAAEGNLSASPTLQHEDGPAFSYLVPVSVGNLIGKTHASKGSSSYADILELWIGIQSYSQKAGKAQFSPDFDDNDKYVNRKRTKTPLLGTYLPFMPDFANRPLWQIFQQYVNHAINEMYTALKVNPDGRIVPAIVFRQIPFTTDAFVPPKKSTLTPTPLAPGFEGPQALTTRKEEDLDVATTKFLDLPRWHAPASLVKSARIGRSNATRTNFIHIYGTSSYLTQGGTPIQNQMLNNKPVRDDVDIFRSGIRPYMTTVDCWVDDTVGKAPGKWMSLIADWTIGSHLTLNGTIEMYGVQAPIAEGDNLSFDGCVYHIMHVGHSATMSLATGVKQWTTTLQLTNGMRNTDNLSVKTASTEKDARQGLVPIYPGFDKTDNTLNDPGLTIEHGNPTTGGDTERKAQWDDFESESDREGKSQLNPADVKDDKARAELKSQQAFDDDLHNESLKGLL